MRYLIYTETFPSRVADDARQTGIGRYCADLASGLTMLGHDVTVATNTDIGTGPGREPYPVQILGGAPGGRAERLARTAQLRRMVRTGRPDVVLLGDTLAHRTVASAGGAVGAPYCPIFYGTELAAWLARSQGRLGWLRHAPIAWFLRQAQASICISYFTAALLHRLAGQQRRECIVHPCVSELCLTVPPSSNTTGEVRKRLAGAGEPAFLLLTVARISERKNQLAVLQAMARLRDSGYTGVRYLVVGNVDSEAHRPYFQALHDFAAGAGLSEAFTVVENTTDEQKIQYLDACDAFIMLSQTAGSSVEGFGISVIEASVRGKPVIVSDEGGMPETVVEGVTGFSVPAKDLTRITKALETLILDSGRRAAMGAAGRDYTLRHFTPGVTAGRLHQQLFNQPRGTPAPMADWQGVELPRVGDL